MGKVWESQWKAMNQLANVFETICAQAHNTPAVKCPCDIAHTNV